MYHHPLRIGERHIPVCNKCIGCLFEWQRAPPFESLPNAADAAASPPHLLLCREKKSIEIYNIKSDFPESSNKASILYLYPFYVS